MRLSLITIAVAVSILTGCIKPTMDDTPLGQVNSELEACRTIAVQPAWNLTTDNEEYGLSDSDIGKLRAKRRKSAIANLSAMRRMKLDLLGL